MRVLQVISHYAPAYSFGGPLQVAHSLSKALVDLGHEVTVCTTSLADHEVDLDVPLDRPIEIDGVTVYYHRVNRLRKWGYSHSLSRRLDELILKADIVLVHNYFQYAGWIGAFRARQLGKPYIVFPHASLKRHSIRASSRILKYVYLWFLERRNYQEANYVVFNAQEELEDSLFSKNGIVISNGINQGDFEVVPARRNSLSQIPNTDNKLIFLFLGRIDIIQKGLDITVIAFSKTVKSGLDAFLILAGPIEGADKIKLENLISKYNISDRVIFTGLVVGEEKLQLLGEADVFIMPSRYEGLSISLLEAMATGLPILLSDRCGLYRLIDNSNCGVVVEPTVTSVSSAMAVMSNPALRRKFGENARRVALRDFTWPTISVELEKLMKLCVRND